MNKLAVHHLPLPGLVTACQFSLCSVFVFGGKLGGCLRMDDFEWEKAKFFIIYVLSFTIGTYTNMKVLSMANVETVIVFRSCTPLAVACFDTIFYNRQMPGARSCFALLLITGGAIAYIMSDREFQVNGRVLLGPHMVGRPRLPAHLWQVPRDGHTSGVVMDAGALHKHLFDYSGAPRLRDRGRALRGAARECRRDDVRPWVAPPVMRYWYRDLMGRYAQA